MALYNTNISSDEAGSTISLPESMNDAYNRKDIDTVRAFFDEDAVFDHATGPDINGTRFTGSKNIRKVFQSLFENVECVSWNAVDTRIFGDKAYCEFHRIAKLKSGEVQDFLSIDVLTFRDGLIIHKDTFYKHRISP